MDFTHRFIPSPDGSNKNTIVLLHGTGGDEEDLIPLGQFLAPDCAMLGVRGKVSENGALRFFRRLAEGVFDTDDLIFRTHELARFLDEARSAYALRADSYVAVGYSNGANIAAGLLLLEPHVLNAAVLFRAMQPLVPNTLPNLVQKRVLMLSGRQDVLIPPDNSQALAELLQTAGADVTLHWANVGHGLSQPEFLTAKVWLGPILV